MEGYCQGCLPGYKGPMCEKGKNPIGFIIFLHIFIEHLNQLKNKCSKYNQQDGFERIIFGVPRL